MAKRKPAGPIKSFTNLDAVLDRMLELGFFGGYETLRNEAKAEILSYSPTDPDSTSDYWYSNGVIELKIFRQMFGSYELCNYRQIIHKDLDSLFELAEIPKIRG